MFHALKHLSAASLLALAGCRPLPDPPADPAPIACASDADCRSSAEEVCRHVDGRGAVAAPEAGEAGICVIPSRPSEGQILLAVRPLDTGLVPPTQLGPLRLEDGQNRELRVDRPVLVQGVLKDRDGLAVESARVRFHAVQGIPGHLQGFDTTTGTGNRAGLYERLLPPGQYRVVALPPAVSGFERPAEAALSDVLEVQATAAVQVVDLTVTPVASLIPWRVRLRVRRGGADVPAAAVAVVAGVLETGGAWTPVSTAAVTSAVGESTLWLPRPADVDPWRVVLRVSAAPEGPVFPEVQSSTVRTVDPAVAEPTVVDLGRIEAPVALRGRVVLADRESLSGGTHVAAWTEGGRDGFRMIAKGSVPEDGRFGLAVIPGLYRVSALRPPADPTGDEPERQADARSGRKLAPRLCVGPGPWSVQGTDGARIPLECLPQQLLSGEVRDHLLQPVASSTVEVTRRADERWPEPLRIRGTADDRGRFGLEVPPGVWDVLVTPPPLSKRPVQWVRGVLLEPQTVRKPSVVSLAPPFELFGQLLLGQVGAEPLPAILDAYAVTGADAQFAGLGVARPDGGYSIVLPGR